MPSLISAGDAAAKMGISRQSLYAYASRGLIEAHPDPADPRRSLYSAHDVERLVRDKARGRKPERIAAAALDFGLPTLSSRLTLIERARLLYRGVDAVRLAREASLEEVARLLWGCGAEDPFAAPAPASARWLADGEAALGPVAIDRCLACLAKTGIGSGMMWQRSERQLWPEAVGLLRLLTASVIGEAPSAEPVDARLAKAWGVPPERIHVIRAALILSADHELNVSSFAVRVVASTGASLAACLAAGLAALSGPLHGGTTSLVEILHEEVEHAGEPRRVAEDRLRRGDRLSGFGHPLYPGKDPRAEALLALLPRDRERGALIAAMTAVSGKEPNIDFALVAARRALGLARGAGLALFALGRAVGWIAHALEQHGEGKLIRPRARYVGPLPAEG